MVRKYYFFRGEMIERFGGGWCWSEEMCQCKSTGIPIYKTIEDARNAIRKYIDGTHNAEPRIIQTAGWNAVDSWYVEH